jgi:hypothetical protein
MGPPSHHRHFAIQGGAGERRRGRGNVERFSRLTVFIAIASPGTGGKHRYATGQRSSGSDLVRARSCEAGPR